MLQRGIAIFLIALILLTGCAQNTKDATDNPIKATPVDKKVELLTKSENTLPNGLSLVWKEVSNYSNVEIPFSPTPYTPSVPKYNISSDLSNIVNISRFKGLSKGQIDKLVTNGFIVLNPNPENAYHYMKMYDIYEENEYKNIPNFITVDVALHIYHKFFDETLKSLEKEQLNEALKKLTTNMLEKTKILYSKTSNTFTKKDLEHIMIYFSVANKLINNTYGDIPQEFISTAEKEIKEIENARGYVKSPLFNFDINYEQFIARGHYEGDEILEPYFKTMMWYGLIGYSFEKDKEELDFNSIEKAMMITYISFLEINGNNDIVLWDKIYSPTNFFVGQSDDINIFDMKELMIKVYGKNVTLQNIKDQKYHSKLEKQITNLPSPQIQNKLVTGAVDTPTKKQFRFMGQRYTLDANIMQELMFPITRPVPSGLDIAGAFGNERAENIAKEYYLMDLDQQTYSSTLKKMKDKVQSLKQTDWQKNMYNGWLWTLKALWTNRDNLTGLPLFMQNQAWKDKNISSGLGSYAELKHDTVLYAKQPVAEMGGGEELMEYCPNYVEPAVDVYDRLLWLVKYSKVNLEKRGLLSERIASALGDMEEVYELFKTCSIKELQNLPISSEENEDLKYIGGKLEYIDDTLSEQSKQIISSAVVSDVAGIADVGAYLEIGTGFPNDILVATYNNGKIYLARGAVYSYYEFLSDQPLTDSQWHEKLGIERVEETDWAYELIHPDRMQKNAPKQPKWINSFKSFEDNKVNISDIEYKIE